MGWPVFFALRTMQAEEVRAGMAHCFGASLPSALRERLPNRVRDKAATFPMLPGDWFWH